MVAKYCLGTLGEKTESDGHNHSEGENTETHNYTNKNTSRMTAQINKSVAEQGYVTITQAVVTKFTVSKLDDALQVITDEETCTVAEKIKQEQAQKVADNVSKKVGTNFIYADLEDYTELNTLKGRTIVEDAVKVKETTVIALVEKVVNSFEVTTQNTVKG